MRGDCGGCVGIPLSVEVIVVVFGFEPYPSSERLIFFWLSVHPSKCRSDNCCALPLMQRLYCLREELCTPKLYYPLSGGFLCGKSCVDELVKILLCEGGDVELGARTSKHIFVFAFTPLSLTLLYCALFILFISYTCLV